MPLKTLKGVSQRRRRRYSGRGGGGRGDLPVFSDPNAPRNSCLVFLNSNTCHRSESVTILLGYSRLCTRPAASPSSPSRRRANAPLAFHRCRRLRLKNPPNQRARSERKGSFAGERESSPACDPALDGVSAHKYARRENTPDLLGMRKGWTYLLLHFFFLFISHFPRWRDVDRSLAIMVIRTVVKMLAVGCRKCSESYTGGRV